MTHLGSEQPDHAVITEQRAGIDECVDEISVAIAEPQQDDVNDIAGVFEVGIITINHGCARALTNLRDKRLVDVIVGSVLPDDHSWRYAESVGNTGATLGRGGTQLTHPLRLLCSATTLGTREGAKPQVHTYLGMCASLSVLTRDESGLTPLAYPRVTGRIKEWPIPRIQRLL